jgi:hypothetical protein
MPIQEPTRQTVREDDRGGSTGAGPLASLQTGKYKFSAYNYPIDIENLSHAMLFNIRVHSSSKDITGQNREKAREEIDTEIKQSRRDRLLDGTPNITRQYKQIKRAISLYMPDNIVFENKQNYESPSLLEKLGIVGTAIATGNDFGVNRSAAETAGLGIAGAAAATLRDTVRNLLNGPVYSGSAAAAAAVLLPGQKKITQTIRTAAQLSGYALNPVIEVLYSTPLLRAFSFDFIFAPRNKKEADVVWKIIMEFRRHSAPEFGAILGGSILIPPSEFQITFLRKGATNDKEDLNRELAPGEPAITPGASGTGFVENTNLPRISTCVLTNIQVDYSPTGGYVTFEDGMPVQIRMRLDFMEINMITREMVDRGY